MEELNELDIIDILMNISDDQAFDSDIGGDSDAEDYTVVEKNNFPSSSTSNQINRRTSKRQSTQSPGSSSMSNSLLSNETTTTTSSPNRSSDILNSDSDISIDPTFTPCSSSQDLPVPTILYEQLEIDYNFDNEPDLPLTINHHFSDISNDSEPETGYVAPFEFTKDIDTQLIYDSYYFTESFGPNVLVNTSSPVKIFDIFFNDFYGNVIDQSNLYAHQCGKNLNLKLDELRAFLGILIIMGFHRVPSIRLYWSADENFFCSRIASIMTQKRFLFILKNLHLNDNTLMPQRESIEFDKLYKIRPMVDHLNFVYESSFFPGRNLSVDETMVGFKGRSTIKQYLPMKPTKRGFKIWALCCSVTVYLLKFMVYEGKKDSREEGSLGEKTVLEITKNYVQKGYCVYFDRFFSSILLMAKLLARKIFARGTMMANRKYFPKDILKSDKSLKMGESDYAISNEISVSKWMDRGKKSVVTVSTMHNPSESTTVKRRNKEGVRVDIICPKSIYDYNKYMGGVDHFDQLIECYNISWKSRRWWMKLFYHFCDTAIVNSFILYTTQLKLDKDGVKPMSHLLYRSMLANELIAQFSSRKISGPSSHIPSTKKKAKISGDGRIILQGCTSRLQNVGDHMPVSGGYNRCRLCSTKKNVKRSKIHCSECNIALCLDCFVPFHSP